MLEELQKLAGHLHAGHAEGFRAQPGAAAAPESRVSTGRDLAGVVQRQPLFKKRSRIGVPE